MSSDGASRRDALDGERDTKRRGAVRQAHSTRTSEPPKEAARRVESLSMRSMRLAARLARLLVDISRVASAANAPSSQRTSAAYLLLPLGRLFVIEVNGHFRVRVRLLLNFLLDEVVDAKNAVDAAGDQADAFRRSCVDEWKRSSRQTEGESEWKATRARRGRKWQLPDHVAGAGMAGMMATSAPDTASAHKHSPG